MPGCSQNTETEFSVVESEVDDNTVLELIGCRPPFPEFDLKTLLSTSPLGNNILKYYETNKELTAKHRNTITEVVCRRIFTRVVNQ